MRLVFAGDREIAVWVLQFIRQQGVLPAALLLPAEESASHDRQLLELVPELPPDRVLRGGSFRDPAGLALLRTVAPEYLICVHFQHLIPTDVLTIPTIGALNLHPAYLPYNRGWHTPTWAILEGTPYGATLHFMSEDVDAGDIVHQKRLPVEFADTAHTLYQRVKPLELEVFREAWPLLTGGSPPRAAQRLDEGTSHRRKELFSPGIQEIHLEAQTSAGELLTRLRALSTSRIEEAAYVRFGTRRHRIQIRIVPEETDAQ